MDEEGGKVWDSKGIILSSNANPTNYRPELISGLFEHFHPFLHIALIFPTDTRKTINLQLLKQSYTAVP